MATIGTCESLRSETKNLLRDVEEIIRDLERDLLPHVQGTLKHLARQVPFRDETQLDQSVDDSCTTNESDAGVAEEVKSVMESSDVVVCVLGAHHPLA